MRVWTFDHKGCTTVETPNWELLLGDKAKVVWVDLSSAEAHTPALLRDHFQFHPLAIEDTLNERQRPKVEEYEDHLFTILNPVSFRDDELHFRELDAFVGENFLVTIHDGIEPMVDEVINRINRRSSNKLPMSSGYLLYVLVDTMVDSYFPLLDSIGDQIDDISEAILVSPRALYLARLFKLKRALSEMWRVVGQQRDMFAILNREASPFMDHDVLRYYLRDVYDHLLRVSDTVNTFRDNLSNVIDLYLSATSNRLNIVVKRLTVYTILFGALAVITGFYGMNFERTFPPFSAEWGVPFVLCIMALAGILIITVLGRDG